MTSPCLTSFPARTSAERRSTTSRHQETRDLQNHASREKACKAQGRNFMPWVHTIMGDTGPEVLVHVLPNQDIYKRLAATEKANHQPIWRAQRRQLEAHARAQTLLYRNSATALDQLSIYPAAAQRSYIRSATVRRPQKPHGAPLKRPPTPPPPPPAPRHNTHRPPRHTATLQRNNHRAAPDTTATRPPYAKKQKRDHKEPQRKRKNSEAAPTQRACRGGTAPPQAVPTTRRNHTTDCAPPQAAHGHARRRGATPGGADAAQHSKSRIWRPLAAASVYGSRATHWGPRVSWGPTCGPSHIDPLQVDAISEVSRPAFTPWAGL